MAIRMKEWGMLAAPGQPLHLRTLGVFGWERVGRSFGAGLGDVLEGGAALAELDRVSSAGELADFSTRLRSISAEVSEELRDEEVQDWDYAWNNAAAPRLREAVQGLSAPSREAGRELARMYSAQASIEARRDRDIRRVSSARGRWEQQVESSISAGQEEQAARWLEAGRGVFVPEQDMEARRQEVRSRACRSRWETRLQASPLEALAEFSTARGGQGGQLPTRKEEKEQLEQSCRRTRSSLRRELARRFSENLHAEQEPDAATLGLAVKAGLIPQLPEQPAGGGKNLGDADRAAWLRWLDCREEGEEGETEARLTIATASLPLAERRALLTRLERCRGVASADRRSLCQQLVS